MLVLRWLLPTTAVNADMSILSRISNLGPRWAVGGNVMLRQKRKRKLQLRKEEASSYSHHNAYQRC